MFNNIEIVRNARVPIIRFTHVESNIEVDISLNNMLVRHYRTMLNLS